MREGTYRYRNLFGEGVGVQNTRVPSTDDTLGFENTEIGFEGSHSLDGLGRGCQDETGKDIFIGNTT